MTIKIFSKSKTSCFNNFSSCFLAAPKSDSLVDKVLELFMAIISLPISAAKYSAEIIRSFKEVKPKTTSEKLAFAANSAVSKIKKAVEPFKDLAIENQSTIVKVVIAAVVVTGAIYAYRSHNSETPTPPDDLRVLYGDGSFIGNILVKVLPNRARGLDMFYTVINSTLGALVNHIVVKALDNRDQTIINDFSDDFSDN